MHCRGLFRRGGGWGGGVTIFLEVNRQVSLMNWQISEYPISLTVTKLLDTEVGPIPLWHIHGGKMYRVKSGIFGQTANFGPTLFFSYFKYWNKNKLPKQHPSETPDVTAHKEPSHLD